MIRLTIYLDGATSECGYKYVITKDGSAWCAFRTDSGFRYFMSAHRLKINPRHTQLYDLREVGKGRRIVTAFHNKTVTDRGFWSLDEIPGGAEPFYKLVNGSYVRCFALHCPNECCVCIYWPNPNAPKVYRPIMGREQTRHLE